eukprot:1597601-Pleurochrysis_carterae.AAC.1
MHLHRRHSSAELEASACMGPCAIQIALRHPSPPPGGFNDARSSTRASCNHVKRSPGDRRVWSHPL